GDGEAAVDRRRDVVRMTLEAHGEAEDAVAPEGLAEHGIRDRRTGNQRGRRRSQATRQWDRVDDAQGDGRGLLTELLVDGAVAAVDEVAFGRGDRPGPVVGEPGGRRRPRRHHEVEAEGPARRGGPGPEVDAI